MSMTTIAIKTETVTHEFVQESLLAVLRQKFQSRNADFVVETSKHRHLKNHAISLRVGPLGLDIRADEADALGTALIAAARHYGSVNGLATQKQATNASNPVPNRPKEEIQGDAPALASKASEVPPGEMP